MTATSEHLRRRAEAAHRLWGGDPWLPSYDDSQPTAHQLEAWHQAVNHIVADGLTPMLPVDVLRAMWRAGGPARDAAERVRRAGGVAA